MQPQPRQYRGVDHQTVGSDILAFLKAVHSPELVLGEELTARLRQVKPEAWYPIGLLLEMLEKLEGRLGAYGLRSMGWSIFKVSHAEAVKQVAKSARDIIYGIDGMYHRANRGTGIGGWKVLSFGAGRAELEKTTPHPCAVEEGILEEALRTVGARATVKQSACVREGAEACTFVIEAKATDASWGG